MAYIIIMLFALCIGSFLNVIIYRLPIMLHNEWSTQAKLFLDINQPETTMTKPFNLSIPRSHCPKCSCPIKWWHNIPLLGFLFTRARCFFCKSRISWRYPIVECLTATISIILYWHYGYTLHTLLSALLAYALITLAFIDLEHQLLPDQITLPFLWLGLIFNQTMHYCSLIEAIYGAALGYGILWIIGSTYKLIKKVDGMGHGDYKCLAMLGAWFGPIHTILILLIASLASLAINIPLLCCKRITKKQTLAFGPYLTLAGMLLLITGPYFVTRWLLW